MTEEFHGLDLTDDEMCGDPRRPRRRPRSEAPQTNGHAADAESLTGELEERNNEQP